MTKSLYPQGYYAAEAGQTASRQPLAGTQMADVCIVGAGFTGLSAALHLAEAGMRVTVLEAEEAGFAASGRNGGQIHTGMRKDQRELERWLGPVHARDLWRIADDAKALVRDLVRRHAIDCSLKDGLVIAAHNAAALAGLRDDTAYLAANYAYHALRIIDADETARVLGTPIYAGAQWDDGGGHLQPLRFVRGLKGAAQRAGTQIFENSRVLSFEETADGVRVNTASGTVVAARLVLATDAFTGAIAPNLAPYIAHVESFIVATEPLPPEVREHVLPSNVAVADTRHVLDYYRISPDGRMLFAGRESYWNPPADIAGLVRPRMLEVFPQLKDVAIDYAWRGTVGITRTRMPHFGKLSERVSFAHGYSGQGVALATMGGKILADEILGAGEQFEAMARVPAQKFPGGPLLRKPLVTAALLWFKVLDAL